MNVLWLIFVVAVCAAAPEPKKEDRVEIFSGVAIEKDPHGEEKLNVKFEPGELKEAARTFEEARGKIKKYAPLLAGIGVKAVAVLGLVFGALTLLVTKALVVAKLAFLAAAALGLHKYLSSNNNNNNNSGLDIISGKVAGGYQTQPQQWPAPTAPAAASYPYARSANVAQDANDLAYKAQFST